MDIKSIKFPMAGTFKHHSKTKLCSLEKNLGREFYKSLECIMINDFKLFLLPFIPIKNTTKYLFQLIGLRNNKTSLSINTKKFVVSPDTQDPVTLVINLFERDYPKSGKYYMGKIKGDNNDKEVDIYAKIIRNGNNYFAELEFPKGTFFEDKTTPFRAYYTKEPDRKIKIPKLELFIDKLVFHNWAVATPRK